MVDDGYKLQDGDEYVSVCLDPRDLLWKCHECLAKGENAIWISAFPNKGYTVDSNRPTFVFGRTMSVWFNKKGTGFSGVVKEDV